MYGYRCNQAIIGNRGNILKIMQIDKIYCDFLEHRHLAGPLRLNYLAKKKTAGESCGFSKALNFSVIYAKYTLGNRNVISKAAFCIKVESAAYGFLCGVVCCDDKVASLCRALFK